ncbi:MAG: hypothetical protein SVM86_03680 [Candidatus Cloacimonadota bacterium]|nr:hypothetical protein [Candidatus Cloacimonadota bacterium]
MKKLFYFLIFIFLVGCSASPKQKIEVSKTSNKQILKAELPSWLYKIPEKAVVGIAPYKKDKESSVDAARKMAAVFSNRNRSSIAISKKGFREAQDDLSDMQVKFRINVGDPKEASKLYENLKIVDETRFHNYYLALFSEYDIEIDTKKVYTSVKKPDWFQNNRLEDEEGLVTYHSTTTSANFISAWEMAAENARLQIAEYIEKKVKGLLLRKNENFEKYVSIETTQNVSNFKIVRSAVRAENQDQLLIYQVYMEVQR